MRLNIMAATLLSLLGIASGNPNTALAQERPMKVIIDFRNPDSGHWSIVNDGVMGGRSTSSLGLTDNGTATFSGYLSLENNGGFASTRGVLNDMDLTGSSGIRLRIKGDGRRYQLRIHTDGNFSGVAYRSDFDTNAGEWIEVFLPFSGFQPTFRGRVPRGARPLDLASIRQIGFMLGDKIEGPFELEIAWLKAVPTDS